MSKSTRATSFILGASLFCPQFANAIPLDIECRAEWHVTCHSRGCNERETIKSGKIVWNLGATGLSRCAEWEGRRVCITYFYERTHRPIEGGFAFIFEQPGAPGNMLSMAVQPTHGGSWRFVQSNIGNDYSPSAMMEGGPCVVR